MSFDKKIMKHLIKELIYSDNQHANVQQHYFAKQTELNILGELCYKSRLDIALDLNYHFILKTQNKIFGILQIEFHMISQSKLRDQNVEKAFFCEEIY